jgi:hypothetical protein
LALAKFTKKTFADDKEVIREAMTVIVMISPGTY